MLSQLTGALLDENAYTYAYDNIGNREIAQEVAEGITYAANDLNQYTRISTNGENFTPEYDADGNQTLIQTSTGTWKVQYNGQNRAIKFESGDGRTVITCGYDYMGRRFEKKVVTNGTTTLHERYIYRGYLQIAAYDLREGHAEHPDLRFIIWDPTQEVATRPLAIRENGVWYTYGWDLTKNICELYGQEGFIRTIYTYSPYGQVTAEGDVNQPVQWSSEMYDAETGLAYYNYRYYNPRDGRWTRRDPVNRIANNARLYSYVDNKATFYTDTLGLLCNISYSIKLHRLKTEKVDKDGNIEHLTTDKVFSGNNEHRNNPDSVGDPDNGPIPPGKYYVIERQSGGLLGEIREAVYEFFFDNDKRKWLALIAIDNRIDDSTCINGKVRSLFRMHAGSKSLGCITFMDKSVFEEVRQFILDTDSETVKNAQGGEYVYYGILEVTAE